MITEQKILDIASPLIEEKGMFVAEIEIQPTNKIVLYLDGFNGVTIKDCVDVSRSIESTLDRDTEDFELLVSSAGIDMPLRHIKQYEKNIGQEVDVLSNDGLKYVGEITSVTSENFEITFEERVKIEGKKKKKQNVIKKLVFTYNEIKSVKVIPSFGKNKK